LHVLHVGSSKHLAVPMKDKRGAERLVVILKYTFAVDAEGRAEVLSDGVSPYLADEFNGKDPAASSIRKPSDLADDKPGTDVLLVGHAHPPKREATQVEVSLRVGPIHKRARVHGLRVWKPGTLGGLSPGPALPIREPVPLIYELAWGGLDLSDPERPVGEPRNTVGRGVAREPRSLVGQPAAQIEAIDAPISGAQNTPVSFGALHRHWQPRASYAGTYDEVWMQTKMPLLPDDFDARFHVTAPPDQWSEVPLRSDEKVEVIGATPEGAWRFQLPRITPGFSSFVGGKRSEHRTHLDTFLVDADARRVELTFRAVVPLPRKYEMLESVRIFEKALR
jgi:hypothetical protein